MAVAVKTEIKKHVDPRVQRTRKLLEQAFIEIMNEKGFQDMTIQDITDRATVNRATFYAHFEDKYDMLDSLVRRQVNEALADKVPLAPVYTVERLQQVIITVMEFLLPIQQHCKPTDRQQMTPLFVSAVQEELVKYLLEWLVMSPPALVPQGVNPQTAANVWSWAIFGTAFQWAQGSQKRSTVEIAREITLVLTASCPSES